MITLANYNYDVIGSWVFRDFLRDTELENGERRAERTRLLDGNTDIQDNGFAEGDRTMRLTIPAATAELGDWVARLWRLTNEARLSARDGVYLVNPNNFTISGDTLVMTFYIKRRLA